MTMKTFLKNLWLEVKDFLSYFASIFTNKAVVVSSGFILGGLIGWSLSGAFRIVLFAFFGLATIPYTTLPIAISSTAVLGGTISFFISQAIAANNWFKRKDENALATQEVAVLNLPVEQVLEEAVVEPVINIQPLVFDSETGVISFHGKNCQLPLKTYQHVICSKLFDRPGARMDEKDILFDIDWARGQKNSDRLIRDAVYAVNRKAKNDLGIENLLLWKRLTVWVNEEYA
jgi:hypothetical protein